MKTLLLIGLVVLLTAVGARAAWAQDDPFFGDPTGCDTGTLEAIEDASPNVDYHAACEQFLTCAAAGRAVNVCQFEAAGRLLEACPADDVHCRNESLLNVAALTLGVRGLYEWGTDICPWTVIEFESDAFSDVLRLFSIREYEQAAMLFADQWMWSDCHPVYNWMEGLLHEMNNQPQDALKSYTLSVDFTVENITPALYSRGLLLGELGRSTEASFDAERLRRFLAAAAPLVLPAMTALTDGYLLDTTPFTEWMAYPVAHRRYGTAGSLTHDLTLMPPISVQIAEFSDLNQLVVLGLIPGEGSPGIAESLWLRQLSPTRPRSGFGVPAREASVEAEFDMGYTGWQMALIATDDLMVMAQVDEYQFLGWSDTYLVVPPDHADPRPALGTRACAGGTVSLLQPMMVVTAPHPEGLPLRAHAGDEVDGEIVYNGAQIWGEPVCTGSDAWWPARTEEGQTGWIRANHGNEVEVVPYRGTWRFLYCPHALPSRLFAGARARVLVPVDLMRAPYDNLLSPDLIPGEVVTVDSERICSDADLWWAVTLEDGRRGYLREADADTYFLEPVPIPPRKASEGRFIAAPPLSTFNLQLSTTASR